MERFTERSIAKAFRVPYWLITDLPAPPRWRRLLARLTGYRWQ